MRKIINMRLNLPRPNSPAFQRFLTQRRAPDKRSYAALQRMALASLIAAASILIALQPVWFQQEQPSAPAEVRLGGAASGAPLAETGAQASGKHVTATPAQAAKQPEAPAPGGRAETADRDTVGVEGARRLILVTTGLGLLFALVRVLRQPKNVPEARDSDVFRKALQDLAPEIQRHADTPREMRRFMNYLRFIAGSTDADRPGQAANFEAELVRLAVGGVNAQTGKIESNIVEYYRTQCDLIGVDPETFQPREE